MKTLRTPEEIISKILDEEEFPVDPDIKPYVMAEVKPAVFELIRIVQKETWNAAVRASAEAAKIKKTGNSGSYLDASVDEDSILTLIEE